MSADAERTAEDEGMSELSALHWKALHGDAAAQAKIEAIYNAPNPEEVAEDEEIAANPLTPEEEVDMEEAFKNNPPE